MRRILLYLAAGLALALLTALGVHSATAARETAAPLLTPTPSPTATPTPDAAYAILQYVVTNNPGWMCQGPTGTPGHRQISNCYPFGNFSHPTNGYADGYADPAAAQAAWQTRRATAQASYPIFGDEDYAGYPGYHAGDTAYPYAHYENYLWGVTWVLGAVSSDDTQYRGSPIVASAIFQAAQALGYLPANPSPTASPTPPLPPSVTATFGPPECEVFQQSASASCTAEGVYSYTFTYHTYGCAVAGAITVYFAVAPSASGPWTIYDQFATSNTFPNPVQGSFYEPSIPGQYAWYQIAVGGVPGPPGPPTTPQPLCGAGTPTVTATPATPTATTTPVLNTPSPTSTATVAGPTPTDTPSVICDTFLDSAEAHCQGESVYAYSFNFTTYCNFTQNMTVTVLFEVAASVAGPWTTYDQQSIPTAFAPGHTTVSGSFFAAGIPAPYAVYRITMYGAPGPSYGASTTPAAFCPGTPTPASTPTPTACPIHYSDVPPSNPFYAYVLCLACRGIVSGYGDGTFRPYAPVTRGQAAKILANAAGYADAIPATQQTFADVPPSAPFWLPVECVALHGVFSGYTCGGPGEPCDAQVRPYFRPAASLTRGQLAKIAATARGYADPIPAVQQTFADVPPAQPFWLPVERAALHGVIGGYACGSADAPCDSAGRPYFRPYANVTRGQTAKIISNTFFPGCATEF